ARVLVHVGVRVPEERRHLRLHGARALRSRDRPLHGHPGAARLPRGRPLIRRRAPASADTLARMHRVLAATAFAVVLAMVPSSAGAAGFSYGVSSAEVSSNSA